MLAGDKVKLVSPKYPPLGVTVRVSVIELPCVTEAAGAAIANVPCDFAVRVSVPPDCVYGAPGTVGLNVAAIVCLPSVLVKKLKVAVELDVPGVRLTTVGVPESTVTLTVPVGTGVVPVTVIVMASAVPVIAVDVAAESVVVVLLETTVTVAVPVDVEKLLSPE